MTERILGVDPGISGGLAMLHNKLVRAERTPVFGDARKTVDAAAVASLLRTWAPDTAIVEVVGPMPKQGISSAFRFGQSLGVVEGVLGALQIPIEYVTPVKWKSHFRLRGKQKEESRRRAIQLYPQVAELLRFKKDADKAEALLIARWYADTH